MRLTEVLPEAENEHVPVILIAEDDVLVRFTTAETLRDAGYTVLEAVDASEVLSLLSTGRAVDLVLSDVRMPGELNGIALTFAVKQLRPDLPIVLVSTHLEPNTVHAGEAFLSKPYRPTHLLDLIEQFVGPADGRMTGLPALLIAPDPKV